jgi:hypothetical protein
LESNSLTISENTAITAYLQDCADHLQQQLERAGGLPDRVRLPFPQTDDEHEALRFWLDHLRQQTGKTFSIDFITAGEA